MTTCKLQAMSENPELPEQTNTHDLPSLNTRMILMRRMGLRTRSSRNSGPSAAGADRPSAKESITLDSLSASFLQATSVACSMNEIGTDVATSNQKTPLTYVRATLRQSSL